MVFFFGARAKADLYYTEYLSSFESKLADFKFIPVLSLPDTEDNWQGKTGYITRYLDDYIKEAETTEAYLCGSPGMINAMVNGLKECGIQEKNIFYDSFS
jgi:Na+-transporting NADH:ubiquinone oxidoreductase subunit F